MKRAPTYDRLIPQTIITPVVDEDVLYPMSDGDRRDRDRFSDANFMLRTGWTFLTHAREKYPQEWQNEVDEIARRYPRATADLTALHVRFNRDNH